LLNKFVSVLLYFSIFQAFASIHVGADNWEDFTHLDGSGIYFELLKEVYADESLQFEITPFARAKDAFEKGDLDIILGIYPEDIKKRIIPSWPLDQESPIVAFYDSRKVKLTHISEIENLTASWVRGYDFEKFIPEPKSTYLVDTPNTGFKLLANQRVQIYIDFPYNLNKKYSPYIKTFQLMPARRIYAAFQNNVRGKRLAKQFDMKMADLMKTGKLIKIFGSYYESTGFKKHVEPKQQVVFHTDEADLLGIQNIKLAKSHSSLYKISTFLDERLKEFNFSYKPLENAEESMKKNMKKNICLLNAIKTPKREKNYIMSNPITMYQGIKLYSFEKLSDSKLVDLSKLMNKNPNYILGLSYGRNYGSVMDKVLGEIDKKQIFSSSGSEISSIKQFNRNRFDLLLESPIIFHGYWSQINIDKTIYSYKLKATTPFILGHVMCNKSAIGRLFIDKVNLTLSGLYQTGVFYNAQKALTFDIDKRAFDNAYKQYFK